MNTALLNFYGIDWLAIGSSLGALYLLGNKNRIGFLLFVLSNICYFAIGIMTESAALILGSLIFFITNTRGFFKWKPPAESSEKQ